MTPDIFVPIAVAMIAAVPPTAAVLVAVRRTRVENTVDHGRVRERLEDLTAVVASAEASNTAAHERLAAEVQVVLERFHAHTAQEEALHRRLEEWLESQPTPVG